jgi:hypothetical protein
MPEYIFVPEESLAAIAKAEAADPLAALNQVDLGPLPKKITAVQVIGTFWILDEDDSEVVRKAHPQE